jgi:hypothetical protein
MKDINNPNVLKEYLEYLTEFADSIYSHLLITDNDYHSLFIESELFCKKVSEANSLPINLKIKLLELKLPKINEEFSLWSLLKLKRRSFSKTDNELEYKRRENILRYKDQLNNLLLFVDAKS